MTIMLFELAGAEPDRRFSPYCWRSKMALAHKGLPVETIAWRFTDKDAIAKSGQGRVPVLLDGDRVVSDSWTIAEYLEDTYPTRPSLFGGAKARRVTRFVNCWADAVVNAALARILLIDIYAHLHDFTRQTGSISVTAERSDLACRWNRCLQIATPGLLGSVKAWNQLGLFSRRNPSSPGTGLFMPTTYSSPASCGREVSAASAY
jgi:Glutathione S-transferase, N-terminal domain